MENELVFDAKFPPKQGFIEVINEDGVHIQIKTSDQIEKELLQSENNLLKAKLEANTQSIAFQEECIVEMAGLIYA